MPLGAREPPVLALEIQERSDHAAEVRQMSHAVADARQCQRQVDPDEERDEPFRRNRIGQRENEDGVIGPVPGERDGHAHDRARGTEDQGDRHRLHEEKRERRAADPAEQIEQDESAPAHPIFDRRAEYEQHEHVEREVQNTRVQEHVRDERPWPLERVQRHQPQCFEIAGIDQHRLLNQEDEQIGDE